MSLKTSCFNKTVFLKNIRQFWPLWGTYLGILLIAYPLTLFNYYKISWAGNRHEFIEWVLNGAMQKGLILTLLFSVFSAAAVFSFLYSIKSAGFYAGLPMRRSGLFFTQFFSGLIWLVVSNLITAIVMLLVEMSFVAA